MIRIAKTDERSRMVITIDGPLAGESVSAVETCCSQAESTRKPVYLFLRDVTTVDQAGRTLLRRLAVKGTRLLSSGIYTLCPGCKTWSRGLLGRDGTPIRTMWSI